MYAYAQILERHVEDALALVPILQSALGPDSERATIKLVDVGSGAGFPGMVLAIARPSWKVTLVDSMNKVRVSSSSMRHHLFNHGVTQSQFFIFTAPFSQRVRFLEHVAKTVPIDNVSTLWGAFLCDKGTIAHR
jgi:16S rRNA G527 N7-methylase RsmG